MLLAAATGLVGTGFHIYNVGKKTGGFSWQNLFYGAPLGAPMAILLSGLVGFCSERVRDSHAGTTPTIFDLPAGRTMAAVMGAGLLGTTGEAGLLHFRGAFHNPFMTLPVTLPPLGAAAHGIGGRRAAGTQSGSRAGGCGCWRRWDSRASAFMPTACRATWAAGATGARTSSTGRRFRRRQVSPALRSPVSPRSDLMEDHPDA